MSTAQVRLHLPGRDHAWWVWSDRGLFDADGKLVEVQAVARDDTELYKARQQLNQSAKMAVLGEMSTGLAHEINQPLNVMKVALANLLSRAESDSMSADYLKSKLERIESQVGRAARIVNHMRVFGRRSEIERQLFSFEDAIEGALSLVRDDIVQKGIELTVAVADLPVVLGHSDQMEQVLINLLINARDAMLERKEASPQLRPKIEISGLEVEGTVLVKVQDNGGGIEPRLISRIFEPFFTTKPAGKGTGLGLSVSYGLVCQMGGKLSVSNQEQGACFQIELPVASGPLPEAHESPGPQTL